MCIIMKSIAEILDEREVARKQGNWVVGCGGLETWAQTRAGKEALYVYQPSTGRHGWLGRDDIVYKDDALSEVMD
jgi:hypothetical protein